MAQGNGLGLEPSGSGEARIEKEPYDSAPELPRYFPVQASSGCLLRLRSAGTLSEDLCGPFIDW